MRSSSASWRSGALLLGQRIVGREALVQRVGERARSGRGSRATYALRAASASISGWFLRAGRARRHRPSPRSACRYLAPFCPAPCAGDAIRTLSSSFTPATSAASAADAAATPIRTAASVLMAAPPSPCLSPLARQVRRGEPFDGDVHARRAPRGERARELPRARSAARVDVLAVSRRAPRRH